MNQIVSDPKLSTSSKLFRKVQTRTSESVKSTDNVNNGSKTTTIGKSSNTKECSLCLDEEVMNLKEQVKILREDIKRKEETCVNLVREKQQLCAALKKERRSSLSLKQQLEDEREFYFKEKEEYCREMNNCKKLKKKFSKTLSSMGEEAIKKSKERIGELQDVLNHTLEVNYNLSVKFMRIKNTKNCLKRQLNEHHIMHKKAMHHLVVKVNQMKKDLAEVVDKRFVLPISQSNKKYLQVVKQNGTLTYDNLCLQVEIDDLNAQIDHFKLSQSRKESRQKFKMLHKDATTQTDTQSRSNRAKVKQKVLHQIQRSHQQNKDKGATNVKTDGNQDMNVVKVFERKKTSGVPHLIMLPEDIPGIKLDEINNTIKSKDSTTQANLESQCSSNYTLRVLSAPDILQMSVFTNKL
ncbi:hypothetical protein FQA39_LY04595 [Lamprigera yunnana]|nr:hypothetical protein FQA39_LY04595 [Lamprigera yunnana]